jgi:hypothetical protein
VSRRCGGEGEMVPSSEDSLNIPAPTLQVRLVGITKKGYIRAHIGSKVWSTQCKLINCHYFPLMREA